MLTNLSINNNWQCIYNLQIFTQKYFKYILNIFTKLQPDWKMHNKDVLFTRAISSHITVTRIYHISSSSLILLFPW